MEKWRINQGINWPINAKMCCMFTAAVGFLWWHKWKSSARLSSWIITTYGRWCITEDRPTGSRTVHDVALPSQSLDRTEPIRFTGLHHVSLRYVNSRCHNIDVTQTTAVSPLSSAIRQVKSINWPAFVNFCIGFRVRWERRLWTLWMKFELLNVWRPHADALWGFIHASVFIGGKPSMKFIANKQ